MDDDRPVISIVVPSYNEQDNVRPLVDSLRQVLEPITADYEIIFVNDGSADETSSRVSDMNAEDPRIKLIELSRNFGHQLALMAGMDVAAGHAVITMDVDLQHPPGADPRHAGAVAGGRRRCPRGSSSQRREPAATIHVADGLSPARPQRRAGPPSTS